MVYRRKSNGRGGRKRTVRTRRAKNGGTRRVHRRCPRRYNELDLKVRSIRDIVLTDAVPTHSEVTGWSLDDFTAGGEVTAASGLYTEFKITKAIVRFIPKNNTADANAVCFNQSDGLTYQANWRAGQIMTAVDTDSISAWTAESEALQYNNLKVTPTWQPWTRTFSPKLKLVALSDTGSSNYAMMTNGWLPTSNSGLATLYRGYKMMIIDCKGSDPGTLPDFTIGRILTTLHVTFRKRR